MEETCGTYKIVAIEVVSCNKCIERFILHATLPSHLVTEHIKGSESAGSKIRALLEENPEHKKLFDTVVDEDNALLRYERIQDSTKEMK